LIIIFFLFDRTALLLATASVSSSFFLSEFPYSS
jgi:hypothetical protein